MTQYKKSSSENNQDTNSLGFCVSNVCKTGLIIKKGNKLYLRVQCEDYAIAELYNHNKLVDPQCWRCVAEGERISKSGLSNRMSWVLKECGAKNKGTIIRLVYLSELLSNKRIGMGELGKLLVYPGKYRKAAAKVTNVIEGQQPQVVDVQSVDYRKRCEDGEQASAKKFNNALIIGTEDKAQTKKDIQQIRERYKAICEWYEGRLEDSEKVIEHKDATIEDLKATIEGLNATIEDPEGYIENLKKDLKGYDEALKGTEQSNREKGRTNKRLEEENREKGRTIKRLEEENREKGRTIKRLEEEKSEMMPKVLEVTVNLSAALRTGEERLKIESKAEAEAKAAALNKMLLDRCDGFGDASPFIRKHRN